MQSEAVKPPVANKPTFKLMKWNVVGSWASDGTQDQCSICKTLLSQFCLHCIASNDPNSVCVVEEGICRHAFHQHCLQVWFNNKKEKHDHNCLVCKSAWNVIKSREVRRQV